jgi:hypothetical protein
MGRLGAEEPTRFPKWESLKNKSGKSESFSSARNDRQRTSFHQRSTTNSPSKNHVLHPIFAKTPSKNAGYPVQKKLLQKRSPFGLGLGEGEAVAEAGVNRWSYQFGVGVLKLDGKARTGA